MNVEKACKVINTPSSWKCGGCGTTEGLCMCVACGYLGCSRVQPGKHAFKHWEETGHCVSLMFTNRHSFCYKCDEYVLVKVRRQLRHTPSTSPPPHAHTTLMGRRNRETSISA